MIDIPEASKKFAAAHPLPEEPGLEDITLTTLAPLLAGHPILAATELALAGSKGYTPWGQLWDIKSPIPESWEAMPTSPFGQLKAARELGEAVLPKKLEDIPKSMSYMVAPLGGATYGLAKDIQEIEAGREKNPALKLTSTVAQYLAIPAALKLGGSILEQARYNDMVNSIMKTGNVDRKAAESLASDMLQVTPTTGIPGEFHKGRLADLPESQLNQIISKDQRTMSTLGDSTFGDVAKRIMDGDVSSLSEITKALNKQQYPAGAIQHHLGQEVYTQMNLNIESDLAKALNIPLEQARLLATAEHIPPGYVDLIKGIEQKHFGMAVQGVQALDTMLGRIPQESSQVAGQILPSSIQSSFSAAMEQARKIGGEIQGYASPASVNAKSLRAADMIRKAKADVANLKDIESYHSKPSTKFFNKLNDEQNIKNISNYEKTGKFIMAPDENYTRMFKETTDQAHKILSDVYGDDTLNYVNNYVSRRYKFATDADRLAGIDYLNSKMKSLSGSKTPLKERTYDVPLDEALNDMKARGINVKPVTANPEAIRQWTIANAKQTYVYNNLWQEAKDSGLIQFARSGLIRPAGMVPLNDKVARTFFRAPSGTVSAGKYYAEPAVARVFNNAISDGLGSSPTVQGLKQINNSLNQFQLGLSGFHFLGTAINAGVSDMALGVKQIGQGILSGKPWKVGEGLARISISPIPFASFAKDVFKGHKFIQGLADNDPIAEKFLKDMLNPAGGRVALDSQWRIGAIGSLKKALKEHEWTKAAFELPQAAIEVAAKPLMELAIPRLKLGAFMDLAHDIQSRLPSTVDDSVRSRALAEAWDSIDNRFGQLAYDNLFWNGIVKDLLLMSTRSVGWNWGTARELGGGVADLAAKTLKGKGISDRTLYTMTLPLYVGLTGAVYQYLHTGKKPQELRDYFYPLNGLTDAHGNQERSVLPTYMKDVVSYMSDPISTIQHKQSPLLGLTYQLSNNRDFFGDMIRNPNDSLGKQLYQTGRYVIDQLTPLSVRQAQKKGQERANLEQKIESFLGIIAAPARAKLTPEQAELQHIREQVGFKPGPRTPEQVEIANQHNELKRKAVEFMDLAKKDKSKAKAFMADIVKTNPQDGELFAKYVMEKVKEETLHITYADKLLKSLPIQARAKYINDKVHSMKHEDAAKWINGLIEKKVITDKVVEELRKL